MLEALTGGPATAGELAALLPIARPGVSRHLRVLRTAGLVEVRQQAQRRVYSLRPELLAEVDEWLGRYRALWEQRLDALHTEVPPRPGVRFAVDTRTPRPARPQGAVEHACTSARNSGGLRHPRRNGSGG